jgi:hypothetical protein
VGSYSDTEGAAECTLAPVDTYVDTLGATAPTPCPNGTHQPDVGSTSCIDDLVSIADQQFVEGNSGWVAQNVTITLDAVSAADVTVHYATAPGTAHITMDYKSASGTATIPAGHTSVTVPIMIKGDLVPENDETFTVTLSSPTGAALGNAVGTITILNDDAPRIRAKTSGAVVEGNAVTITYTLSKQYYQDITLTLNTADLTASASAGDYQPLVNATVTIPAGQLTATVTIATYTDGLKELMERFTVTATSPDITNGPKVTNCVIKANVT